MKDRIKLIQNTTNLSQQDFAKRIGVAPGSLSSIYSGRTQPTNNYVVGIHKAFPEVSVNWLMFGEGDMYVSTEAAPSEGDADLAPTLGADGAQGVGGGGSLFDQPDPTAADVISFQQPRRQQPVGQVRQEHPRRPEIDLSVAAKDFDIKKREVKEIRVFFSDGTYETFVPSK